MTNFTSNTYTLKRKILTFTNKISKRLSKPNKKFVADITYGILASESCLLTDVVDQLHESSKKITNLQTPSPSRQSNRGAALFGKATFAMDRGYDDKMLLKMEEHFCLKKQIQSRKMLSSAIIVYKRRRQAVVSDETSKPILLALLSSTLP